MAMDLKGHIHDLITVGTEMRNNPGVNKKALNKTIARLEEAELWAGQIQPGKIDGVPDGAPKPFTGSTQVDKCTCPEGAVAADCPVHNP